MLFGSVLAHAQDHSSANLNSRHVAEQSDLLTSEQSCENRQECPESLRIVSTDHVLANFEDSSKWNEKKRGVGHLVKGRMDPEYKKENICIYRIPPATPFQFSQWKVSAFRKGEQCQDGDDKKMKRDLLAFVIPACQRTDTGPQGGTCLRDNGEEIEKYSVNWLHNLREKASRPDVRDAGAAAIGVKDGVLYAIDTQFGKKLLPPISWFTSVGDFLLSMNFSQPISTDPHGRSTFSGTAGAGAGSLIQAFGGGKAVGGAKAPLHRPVSARAGNIKGPLSGLPIPPETAAAVTDAQKQKDLFREGWKLAHRDTRISNNQKNILDTNPANLTRKQEWKLIREALNLLYKDTPANQAHIADHFKDIQHFTGVLQKVFGIDALPLIRNAAVHDVSKVWDAFPKGQQVFMSKVFGNDFLSKNIMGHDINLGVIELLLERAGISLSNAPGLKAEVANHNAGYGDIPGFHFWRDVGWGPYKSGLQKQGIPVSDTPHVIQGGTHNPNSIILTLMDRGSSLSLANIQKFANTWKTMAPEKGGGFGNDVYAKQIENNNSAVTPEVAAITNKMAPYVLPGQNIVEFIREVEAYYGALSKTSSTLAQNLRRMAKGEGEFAAGRPQFSKADLTDAIVYQTKSGEWFRVTKAGDLFQFKGNVAQEIPLAKGKTKDANMRLFEIIFRDIGYEPPVLRFPEVPGFYRGLDKAA